MSDSGFSYENFIKHLDSKSIPHDITEELTTRMLHEPCVFCGVQLVEQQSRKTGPGNALGTIDAKDGFVSDNVITGCEWCLNTLGLNLQFKGTTPIKQYCRNLQALLKKHQQLHDGRKK